MHGAAFFRAVDPLLGDLLVGGRYHLLGLVSIPMHVVLVTKGVGNFSLRYPVGEQSLQ